MTSNVKWSLRRECRFLLLFALPCLLAAAPPAETTAPPAAVKKPRKLDPRDAWIAAQPRFIQADREICEAIEARLASIKNYLEERKAGARPFAAAVLSLKGKMLYTEGVATQVVDAVAGLFGSKPSEDGFANYVRECFHEHVLDESKLQKVIDDAVAGFAGDVRDIDSQFLVDLRADLADDAIKLEIDLPQTQAKASMNIAVKIAVNDAVKVAGKDIAAMIVTQGVSIVAGNAIGDTLNRPGDSGKRKLAVNAAVGYAVDKAIDGVVAGAGFDPLAKVTETATEAIDITARYVIDGGKEIAYHYPIMFKISQLHPNTAVRAACFDAVEVMDRRDTLGLRHRLYRLQFEQSRRRGLAVFNYLLGPDVQVPEYMLYPPVAPDTLPEDEEIISDAAAIKAFFGVNR
ncbi:hypothetical protein [Singulisphaera acidiphila]|nr:hypothetical protein [Singulisphaera acidiphila]